MPEKRNLKQNFKRSAIISSVIGIIAYIIFTRIDWGLFGFELGDGAKHEAAVENDARTAAVTETVTIIGKTWTKKILTFGPVVPGVTIIIKIIALNTVGYTLGMQQRGHAPILETVGVYQRCMIGERWKPLRMQ